MTSKCDKENKKTGNARRSRGMEPVSYFRNLKLAYEMAELGANSRVLFNFFVVDKRLELSINKELGKFRRGDGWINTHVVHRLHANIVYRMYCNAVPENSDLKRDLKPEEILALSRTYMMLYNNEFMDINRIFYTFGYLRDGTFNRKICSSCGIDFIFHSQRSYQNCPFCEKSSKLYSK